MIVMVKTQSAVFQVLFFPKDSLDTPSTFVAFCPYTLVHAEGTTVHEAALRWMKAARKAGVPVGRLIPRYMITSTKIL